MGTPPFPVPVPVPPPVPPPPIKFPPDAGTNIPGFPDTGVVAPGTVPLNCNISSGTAAKDGDDAASGVPSTG